MLKPTRQTDINSNPRTRTALVLGLVLLFIIPTLSQAQSLLDHDFRPTLAKDFTFSDTYGDYAAITFNMLTRTYFLTDNKLDAILEISQDGSLRRTIDISALKTPENETADVEGIAWMYGETFALAGHDGKELLIVNITPATTALTRNDAEIYLTDRKPKGLAYRPSEDVFYWVGKDNPKQVVSVRINTQTNSLEELQRYNLDFLPVLDLADAAFFPRLSPHIFLISESSKRVMEVDLSASPPTLVTLMSLGALRIPKAGGLVFNHLGHLAIVGKRVRGVPEDDFNVFEPASPIPNQPPVANLGPSIVVTNTDGSGFERVVIPATGSYDPDGSIVFYEWRINRAIHSQGFRPVVDNLAHNFPIGETIVTLQVRDELFVSSAARVFVTVLEQPIGRAPPLVSAVVPTGGAVGPSGTATIFVDASASSDPGDNTINRFLWTTESQILYDGSSSTATLRFSGVGTYTLTLTVFSISDSQAVLSASQEFSVKILAFAMDPSRLAGRVFQRTQAREFQLDQPAGDFAGITYSGLTNTYFVSDNKVDIILEIQPNGIPIRTIDIAGLKNPSQANADVEGLAWMRGETFVLAGHDGRELLIVDITPATRILSRSDAKIFTTNRKPKGVAYHHAEEAIYWVGKDEPKQVVKVRVNSLTDELQELGRFNLDFLPVPDLVNAAFSPALSPHLFVISENGQTIFEVDITVAPPVLHSAFTLTPWPIPRPSGLAFDPGGKMSIVGKNRSGVAETHFNVFSSAGGPSFGGMPPLHHDGQPALSLNYIHPGAATQQAEFFIDIQQDGVGEVHIFDQAGRRVRTLQTPYLVAEQYRLPWDLKNNEGSNVASGLYHVLIKTPTSSRKEKMVIVR